MPGSEHDLRHDDGVRAAYAEHGAELYRFALRQLDDDGAARDVVQETFVRAWRAADRFDPSVASLRVWLFAIARNLVIDESRRRAARPATPHPADLLTDLSPSVGSADDQLVLGWLVEEALGRIRPEARSALVETYLRGRPYAEVAAELGVPVGTLRSRVFYGLKALRLAMDEMGVEL
ncbi:sigma-70 family RNA polymerase sigma factor [Kribbella sandramycini]|uniref:RNA polymerase sigma-70 factor (ECF subfamily) n=1 Tax=Kribbella sandramycini TaxID=60450 RepID=A0A7Y4L755_9ACTN|nr:sigma-70 family RNA polymerase sigma factor [Kribbella sandramycini]MBB6568894.1 RNA polymerase sigma-70 factor (ECF subfamily) [Kribbella sandramycini]NOL45660.1 sigma-70 family RNA polymerase sigma factor [Kribbella sandramycini]